MKKIETIWHHILYRTLSHKQYQYTQKELAIEFDYSLSTVHHALKIPVNLGAIRKTAKFFIVEDFEKLLFYWASIRNLEKDIVYRTFLSSSILELEGLAPDGSIYAAYSAAKKFLSDAPADYSKLYLYYPEKNLNYLKQRFPPSSKEPNIFILRLPPTMICYGLITTLPQTFVDIWNLHDWYAHEFTDVLREKIHGLLS